MKQKEKALFYDVQDPCPDGVFQTCGTCRNIDKKSCRKYGNEGKQYVQRIGTHHAKAERKAGKKRCRRLKDPVEDGIHGEKLCKVILPFIEAQAVVGECLPGSGRAVVSEREKDHGETDGRKTPGNQHDKRREGEENAACHHRLFPAPDIGEHTGGISARRLTTWKTVSARAMSIMENPPAARRATQEAPARRNASPTVMMYSFPSCALLCPFFPCVRFHGLTPKAPDISYAL